MQRLKRSKYKDISTLMTYDIEIIKDRDKNFLHFHGTMHPRRSLEEKVERVNTSHVFQYISNKYTKYKIESCHVTDEVNNGYTNGRGVEKAKGLWVFELKSPQRRSKPKEQSVGKEQEKRNTEEDKQ